MLKSNNFLKIKNINENKIWIFLILFKKFLDNLKIKVIYYTIKYIYEKKL